jgi:outer membrane biosynthesis protein TonB
MEDEKPKPKPGSKPEPEPKPKSKPEPKSKSKSEPEPKSKPGDGERSRPDRKQVRLGAALATVVAVVLVGWLLIGGDDESSPKSDSGAEAATVDSLRESAAERGTPIYWAGPQEDAELEVTETEAGERTYIRYLTGDAEPGDPQPFLTVGTYAFPNAAKALKRQARESGGMGVLRTAPGGGTVYFSRDRPESVYLAFPGIDVEIEVYDPDPQRALNLVTSGQIVPVS